MKKRVGLLGAVAVLTLFAGVVAADDAVGTSATVSPTPVVGPAESPALCSTPSALFEAAAGGRGKGGGGQECTCIATADCGTTTISCSDTTGPCQCESADRHCLAQRGYVTCNGVTEYCPKPCCLYIQCENGRTCSTNDDCCGAIGLPGFCNEGQCQCFE